MSNPVDWLFRLLRTIERVIPEAVGEVTASLVLLAAILGVRHLARRARSRLGQGPGESRKRLLVSAVVTVATGLGVLLFIGIWGLLDPLLRAYRNLGLTEYGGEVVLALVVLGGAYTLTTFIGRVIEEVAGSRQHVSRHQREIFFRLTQVTLYAVAILVVLALFTKNLGSLLVGAGFLGIVVGMAARQTLGAVLAGFVLMFSRPFEIGDWVSVGDHEGTVTDITVVNTRLRTPDGEFVVIPNDVVGSESIVNRSRKGRLRVEVEVGVDYDDDPEEAASVAVEAAADADHVIDTPKPNAVLKRFGASGVVLGVRVWIDNPSVRRMWQTRTAVVAAVKSGFDAAGLSIPYPQRSVSTRGDPAEDLTFQVAVDGDASGGGVE